MSGIATSRRDVMRSLAIAPPALALSASALASPVPTNAWDNAVKSWRLACALQDAFYKIGPMREANRDYELRKTEIAERYGSLGKARANAKGAEELDRAFDVMTGAEDLSVKYVTDADRAAERMLRVPAPDIEAVRVKIDAAKDHALVDDLGDEVWRIISADIVRLGGGKL